MEFDEGESPTQNKSTLCWQYFPFGETFIEERTDAEYTSYLYNGKELDAETGLYYYGARYYDPRISIFYGVDPLNEEFPSWTPYHYVHNNPLNMVDPTGMAANPVYNEEGVFLGTDDLGLQGKAIVMDEANFVQGMSHTKALGYNKGVEGLKSVNAGVNLLEHYNGLSSRPDYDGIVTPNEGMDWAKAHPNLKANPDDVNFLNATPNDFLYLDAAKMDFGRLTSSYFKKVGIEQGVNLLDYVDMQSSASISTTYALGRTHMTKLNNSGEVRVTNGSFNAYDWDYGGSWSRAILIFGNRLIYGLNDSHGVPVTIYGTGKLNNYQPYTGAGSGASMMKSMNWSNYRK